MSSIWGIGPDSLTGGREAFFRPAYPRYRFLDIWARNRKRHQKIAEKLAELSEKKPAIAKAQAYWQKETADLSDYCPYRPVEDIDLVDANNPKLVDAELKQRKAQQAKRIQELEKLVSPWGIALDYSLMSLDALELWFSKYVQIFTKQSFLEHLRQVGEDKGEFHLAHPVWYSIALDISFYMFSMLQRDLPNISWGVGRGNRIALFCSDDFKKSIKLEEDIQYEELLWLMMITLKNNRIPNRFFDDLSREYKKTRKRCKKALKK